ncbi:MAG: hypothetical protein IJW49_02555 [Clostridia bacterium]|nr:hypothetical protein [Clostridia bacterium]
MKKILSLALVVVLLLACFTACGSIDSYADKLEEAGYKVEVVEEDEIAEYADKMGLNADESAVVSMLYAAKADGLIPSMVVIMECADSDAAEHIAETADGGLGLLGMSVEVEGKFVIAGTSSAVEAAMG